jgi:hypothetical protein
MFRVILRSLVLAVSLAAGISPLCADQAPVAANVAAKQYQVEYRHPTHTNNEWRVGLAWTTNYDYAKSVFDRLAEHYDVRLYERTR